jgi:hypothetical protein
MLRNSEYVLWSRNCSMMSKFDADDDDDDDCTPRMVMVVVIYDERSELQRDKEDLIFVAAAVQVLLIEFVAAMAVAFDWCQLQQ